MARTGAQLAGVAPRCGSPSPARPGRSAARSSRQLQERGDEVVAVSRDPSSAGMEAGRLGRAATCRGFDGVIHLAGEPIDQRWSEEGKARDPRLARGRRRARVVDALRAAGPRPRGARVAVGRGLLPALATQPSARTRRRATASSRDACRPGRPRRAGPRSSGVRVVTTRTGVVLSRNGGALAEDAARRSSSGVGGPVAGGTQPFPWIHLHDVAGAMLFAARHRCGERPDQRRGARQADQQELHEGARPGDPPAHGLPSSRLRHLDALRRDGLDRHRRLEPRPGEAGVSSATSSSTPSSMMRSARSRLRPS